MNRPGGRYGVHTPYLSWEEKVWAEDALEALRLARKALRVMPPEEVRKILEEGPREAVARLRALLKIRASPVT